MPPKIRCPRYVTAVASGKKYNYQLMNKIVDADGKTVKKYKADYEDISDTLTSSQWDAISFRHPANTLFP